MFACIPFVDVLDLLCQSNLTVLAGPSETVLPSSLRPRPRHVASWPGCVSVRTGTSPHALPGSTVLIVLHAASCVGLNGLESLVQQVRKRNGHRHMAKKFKGTRNCPPDCTPSQLLDAQVLLWLSVRPAQTAHSLEHLESVLHIAIQSVAHSYTPLDTVVHV